MAERNLIPLHTEVSDGHCGACKFWASDEAAVAATQEPVGHCQNRDLVPFDLLVSPDSGCNHFAKVAEQA